MPAKKPGDPFHCDWRPIDGGLFACAKCDRRVTTNTILCNCPADLPPGKTLRSVAEAKRCVFRGEEIRRESTTCCGGKKTRHKVFACQLHPECQIGAALPRVRSCCRCEDYSKLPTPTTA